MEPATRRLPHLAIPVRTVAIFHTLGSLIAAEQAAEEGALTKQLSNWRSRSLIADHPEQPGTYINHKKRPVA